MPQRGARLGSGGLESVGRSSTAHSDILVIITNMLPLTNMSRAGVRWPLVHRRLRCRPLISPTWPVAVAAWLVNLATRVLAVFFCFFLGGAPRSGRDGRRTRGSPVGRPPSRPINQNYIFFLKTYFFQSWHISCRTIFVISDCRGTKPRRLCGGPFTPRHPPTN